MPRYRFQLDDGSHLFLSREHDYPDDETARRDAIRSVSDYATDQTEPGSEGAVVETVRDEAGEIVLTVRLTYQFEPV